MTAALARDARSAYPPAIADLMPRAVELTQSLDGVLPSQNRLTKSLHIGKDKAKAVLAELAAIAERDQRLTDVHTAMVVRGSLADRPPLTLVPDPSAEPAEAPSVEPAEASADDTDAPSPDGPPAEASSPPADSTVEAAPVPDVAPASEPAALARPAVVWPVFILCLPAFVAIWGGWVAMGQMTGFGKVTLLPGIVDSFHLNTAITLPVGVETYAAYALFAWLSGHAGGEARRFAKWSALVSLGIGAAGQIAYHLMAAAGWQHAPWPITAVVSCIPVAVLGMGAALAHLMHKNH